MSGPPNHSAGPVWVYGEHAGGRFHHVVFELVGKGAELAEDLGAPLEVVAVGGPLEGPGRQLRGLPVDALHLAAAPGLDDATEEPKARVLAHLIEEAAPQIVLAGATAEGRSLIPRVAILCETGLTADCTGLEIDPDSGNLLQTRPAFGGNIIATIVTRRHRPQMATVRPRVMSPAEPRGDALPELRRREVPAELLGQRSRLLQRRRKEAETVNIAEADVLVAGGRGLGGPEGFGVLEELAELLGAEVAASRAAVDAGWAPYERQVGQTGKTVQPDLYVAVGISGAVQHRVGMQSAGTIVALNTDPHAPIFEFSDYGVVGDYRRVLPPLMESLRREREGGDG